MTDLNDAARFGADDTARPSGKMDLFTRKALTRACAGLSTGLVLLTASGLALPQAAQAEDLTVGLLAEAPAPSAVAEGGNASALVSWTPTAGATGYQVRVNRADTGALVSVRPSATTATTATTSSYTVTSLTNGTAYTFTVVAKTATGDVAYPVVSATPKAVANRPTLSTTVTGASGQLSYKWTAASVPTGAPAITGYQLTLTPNDGSAPVVKDLGNVVSATVTGLIDGVVYKAAVRSVNANGLSYASTSVVVASPAPLPAAPTSVLASRSSDGTAIDVSWAAPANEPGSAVSRYVVSFTPTNGAKAIASKSLYRGADGSVPTTASFTGVPATGSYNVRILAYSVAGTGVWSSYAPVSSPGAYAAAVNPAQSAVTTSSVKLVWKAALTGLDTPAVTGYKLTMTAAGAAPVVHDLGNVLTDTFTGLTEGTLYTFTLQPVNANGVGPVSTSPAKIAPAVKPAAPTAVTAVRQSDPTQAEVSWAAPSNALGASITRYIVTTTSTNGAPTVAAKTISRAADGSTATRAILTGLTASGAYTVKVTPYSSAGTGTAAAPVSISSTQSAPSAPEALSVVPADAALDVSWTAPINDGGSAVTGYVVSYSSDGSTWQSQDTSTMMEHLSGLTNGTSYQVKVAAVNAYGQSPFSAAVSATPVGVATLPSAPAAPSATLSADAASASVSWSAPSSNGGAAISGYVLQYSNAGQSTWGERQLADTSYLMEYLNPGTAYRVRVAAVNSAGQGDFSAETVFQTPVVDPVPVDQGGGSGSVEPNPVVDPSTGGASGSGLAAMDNVENEAGADVSVVTVDETGVEGPTLASCFAPAGQTWCSFTASFADGQRYAFKWVDRKTKASKLVNINTDAARAAVRAHVVNHLWNTLNDNYEAWAKANGGADFGQFAQTLESDADRGDDSFKVFRAAGNNNGALSIASFKQWEKDLLAPYLRSYQGEESVLLPMNLYMPTGQVTFNLIANPDFPVYQAGGALANGNDASLAWRTPSVNYVYEPTVVDANGGGSEFRTVPSLQRQGRLFGALSWLWV